MVSVQQGANHTWLSSISNYLVPSFILGSIGVSVGVISNCIIATASRSFVFPN